MVVIRPNLGLRSIRDAELDDFGQHKVDSISASSSYPGPGAFPELDAVIATLPLYRDAVSKAEDGTKADTEHKNNVRALFEFELTKLALKCAEIANGDRAMFLETGFDIQSQGSPVGRLPKPRGLEAFEGNVEGSILLRWGTMPLADSFPVEVSEDVYDADSWSQVGIATASTFLVEGLTPGTQYFFRVAAVNSAGQSRWSDPATRIAL